MIEGYSSPKEAAVKRSSNGPIGRPRTALVAALAALLCLCLTSAASARTIVLGPPIEETTSFGSLDCDFGLDNCSVVNIVIPGAKTVAPVDGVLTSWSIKGASANGSYQLYTLSRAGTTYTANAESTIEQPASSNVESFSTNLPIKKGEYLGLGINEGATIGFNEPVGSEVGLAPLFQQGGSGVMETDVGEFAFDAELAPAPTIAGLTPQSGLIEGGTTVTISGSDFKEASAVKFGLVPALAFTVDSETQITAVSPPRATTPAVAVSVTTPDGTGTSSQLYSYVPPTSESPPSPTQCFVPNLKGKKLKAARKALSRRHCALGKVKGKRGRSAKVTSQHPNAGAELDAGAKVGVKVG
jgi:IPT/TIG domain-containing protein/PASTA domain-containing protein